jgi:hypothetical protein
MPRQMADIMFGRLRALGGKDARRLQAQLVQYQKMAMGPVAASGMMMPALTPVSDNQSVNFRNLANPLASGAPAPPPVQMEISPAQPVVNEQGVTDSILGDLTDSDLKELGVEKLGERKRLLAAFGEVVSASESHFAVESEARPAPRQEDFTYEAANGELAITGFRGKGHAVIPSRFDDLPLPVRYIGAEAFKGNNMLTGVTIPEGVTQIGKEAFAECSSLTTVEMCDSLLEICHRAFGDCKSLADISIPQGVKIISGFVGCTRLTSVVVPDSVECIGNSAFQGCIGLTSVTIPGNVTRIEYGAFHGCSGLTSVSIPNSVTSIDSYSFKGCTGLTSIGVAASNPSYSSIDGVLFDKNADTLITCPEGKSGAFVIPGSVTSVGLSAFQDCTGLTSVAIPDSVTRIWQSAFWGCTGLTSLVIPDSVTIIERTAFAKCSGLASVAISSGLKRIEHGTFGECDSLTEVTIPAGVELVCESAFAMCKKLAEVKLMKKTTVIEADAFWECPQRPRVSVVSAFTRFFGG